MYHQIIYIINIVYLSMNYNQYWAIRYTTISISLFMNVLIILLVLIQKLYQYLACLYVFFMQIAFLIVNISAISYQKKYANGHQYESEWPKPQPQNYSSPHKTQCLIEAYFIHSFWLVGFNFSLLIVYSIKNILYGQGQFIKKHKIKLMILCVIFPLIIMTFPFIYGGYGPSGFQIPRENDRDFEFAYFFCGWYSGGNSMYFLYNNSIPTWILLVLHFYFERKISKIKEDSDIEFNYQERMLLKIIYLPRICMCIWGLNVLLRIQDIFKNSQIPLAINYIILILNTFFDLIPAVTCCIFLYYVFHSIPLKVFKFNQYLRMKNNCNVDESNLVSV